MSCLREERKSIIINEIEHGNILQKPKKINIDIRGVTGEEELQELKKCFQNGGETDVMIKYGSKNAPEKVMIRKVNLEDDSALDCLKKWAVINY